MALLRERESDNIDPVEAFIHTSTGPTDVMVSIAGDVVETTPQEKVRKAGPPLPIIFEDETGKQFIPPLSEQTGEGIAHFLKPETRVRRVTAPPAIQIRRKLALVVSRL